MKIDLSGKTVLVTGASRGIGNAIATQFGNAGATLAIHCFNNLKPAYDLAKKIGNDSMAFQADLSDMKEVKSLYQSTIEKFGKIDILINNAGIAISSDPLKGDDEFMEEWQRTMRVNLDATAFLSKLFLQQNFKNRKGYIVNISSRAAFRGDTKDYLAYAASKAGMVALTRSIARAYGKMGIMAFNIAPGFTRTDMAQDFMDQYGEEYALNDIALTKLTEPKDIAPTVVFLCSGLADHATGCTIDINAGSYVH